MLLTIEEAVKQGQPQVGHAHFVEVGEEQGHPQGDGAAVFYDRVDLPAQIPGGALYPAEIRTIIQGLILYIAL